MCLAAIAVLRTVRLIWLVCAVSGCNGEALVVAGGLCSRSAQANVFNQSLSIRLSPSSSLGQYLAWSADGRVPRSM